MDIATRPGNRHGRMDGLTGLRAVAALAVLLFHYSDKPFHVLGYREMFPWMAEGGRGVDLFFVLSGFVIAHAHLKDFRTPAWDAVWRFLALRLARMYPLHFAVIAMFGAALVAAPLLGFAPDDPGRFSGEALVRHLLLVNISEPTWNYPAWSISAEWFAYLSFPVLAVLLIRYGAWPTLLACAVILGPVSNASGAWHIAVAFPLGAALYVLTREASLRLVAIALTAAAAGGLALGGYWFEPALMLAFAAAVLICADRNPLSRLLSTSVMVWLGNVSFAVYMVHAFVQGTAGKIFAKVVLGLPEIAQHATAFGLVAGTVVLAALMHYAIEEPAREWARVRLKRQRPVDATISEKALA